MKKNNLMECEQKPKTYWDKVLIYSEGSMLLRFYRFLERLQKKRSKANKHEK